MSYIVQTGETIAAVTQKLGFSFAALKQANPHAVGRTRDGRWFFKAGARLDAPGEFDRTLTEAIRSRRSAAPTAESPPSGGEPAMSPDSEQPTATVDPDEHAPPSPPDTSKPQSWWDGLRSRLNVNSALPSMGSPPSKNDLSQPLDAAHLPKAHVSLPLARGLDIQFNASWNVHGSEGTRIPEESTSERVFSVGVVFRF